MEKIVGLSKITRGFQITLIDDVRKSLGIKKQGEKIIYVKKDDEIIIRRV